jgi:hypothetical protein
MTGLSRETSDDQSTGAHRWRRRFEDRTIVCQRVRNLPQAEAERSAIDIVLVELLDATHPTTDPTRCANCGRPETPDATLLPIGWGERHSWAHPNCWEPWRERRRAEVTDQLSAMGIAKP